MNTTHTHTHEHQKKVKGKKACLNVNRDEAPDRRLQQKTTTTIKDPKKKRCKLHRTFCLERIKHFIKIKIYI